MINWPETLVEELAARRGIVFLGAGASASSTRLGAPDQHPPTWGGLLELLYQHINRGEEPDREAVRELLDSDKYLEAAEILRKVCIYKPDYERLVGMTFERFRPTEVHKAIERLDQKVVITTNFDTLYEDHCRQGDAAHGYAVLNYYDHGLINRLRSPKRVIVKVHGCVTAPELTVLTKSDFFEARSEYSNFFRTLESLFLTQTLLFIGYSISDPDIQLLLENSTIAAKSEHPHYAVMRQGQHSAIRGAFLRTYSIEILEFDPANNYEEFLLSLQDLADKVEEARGTQP